MKGNLEMNIICKQVTQRSGWLSLTHDQQLKFKIYHQQYKHHCSKKQMSRWVSYPEGLPSWNDKPTWTFPLLQIKTHSLRCKICKMLNKEWKKPGCLSRTAVSGGLSRAAERSTDTLAHCVHSIISTPSSAMLLQQQQQTSSVPHAEQ